MSVAVGQAWTQAPQLTHSESMKSCFWPGDTIDAKLAAEWGLVSRVVSPDQLMETARGLAQRIAANPPHAVRLTKRLLRESMHTRLDTLLEMSAAFQSLSHGTADHREAVAAFLEKRPPVFKG